MSSHSDAGIKLGIEGEREFKSSLKDINATMKVLGSEMTLVASKFDKQDKSVQALNARNSVLNAAINEQRNKIELLQKALANATLSFGEADSRTKAWQEKLNKAQAELNNMERELDQNNKALKNAGEEYDDAGKESKKFGEEVKDSGEKAEKSGHKLETLGKIAKGLGVAFTAAFAAMGVAVKKVVGVIGDCVDVYADFDDSMRQVAATMGMSADEIGQAGGDFERLSQAAKDAGASTRYTASDAADALNYLALAGYDTNKAIETMPKVLTLAAAGGMDLAYASDMVTDSMSALNLQTSDLDMYMDQMAKTSQKSNTSVQQLGEAILVCGGTASLTGQDLDVVNTALGVMADNGIKGSEGGTKLRNVLLSLSSPTKNGAAELARLGVSIYDAEGNMRQLDAIMGDLNKALSSLSQEEKTAAISAIFNKRDIAAVNALLESTNGRFAELDALIKNSAGAAEEMAGTMESGLAGTERSWASALEGLKIETGEIFASLKQTALTDMAGIVRDLTKALASADGDWMKIGDAVGQAVSNLLVKINEYLPKVVQIAVNIISVFLSGIAENTDMLVSSAELIIGSLIDGLNYAAPNLVAVAVPLLLTLADGILSSLPSILSAGHEILMTLVSGLTQAAPELLTRLAETTVLIAQSFIENAPIFLETAVSLGEALFGGILSAASVLAEAAPGLLASFGEMLADGLPSAILVLTSALTDAFPLLLTSAFSQLEFALQTILSVLPYLLGDGIPMLLDWLGSFLLEQLPVLIEMAGSLVTELVGHLSEILVTTLPLILSAVFRLIDSIIAELPLLLQQLLPLIFTLVEQLLGLLVQLAPEFLQAGLMLFNSLIGALEMICGQLLPLLPSLIQNLCSLLTENLPLVISAAAELYSGLVRALPAVAQQLLPMIPVLILTIGQILIENTPLILEAGTQLLFALLDAIPVVADALISSLPLVWQTIKQTLLQAWPIIRDVGGQLLDGLIVGIGSMIGKVWDKVKEVGAKIIESIKNALGIHSPSSVFAGIGENLMLGLWNGISDSVGWILDKVRDFGGTLIDTVKSVFGISSPSKVFADEIGKNLGLGVGVGFEDAMRDVSKDMADAIPTDFDVAANVHGTPEIMPGSGGGISLTLHIENFHNYRSEDINELADELSVILASKMNRKAAAF